VACAVGANNVARVESLTLTARPLGATFEGTIYRLENPARGTTSFDVHAGNVAANHRYSGPGYGASYGATSPTTAFAEVEHYGLAAGRVSISQNVKLSNVLDLTSPSVRGQLNVSLEQITGNSYAVTQKLGEFARSNGYSAILAPSARNAGGSNLVLFPKVSK
jgi:RES domain-containing protein